MRSNTNHYRDVIKPHMETIILLMSTVSKYAPLVPSTHKPFTSVNGKVVKSHFYSKPKLKQLDFRNCLLYRALLSTEIAINFSANSQDLSEIIGKNIITYAMLFDINLLESDTKLHKLFRNISNDITIITDDTMINKVDLYLSNTLNIPYVYLKRCFNNAVSVFPELIEKFCEIYSVIYIVHRKDIKSWKISNMDETVLTETCNIILPITKNRRYCIFCLDEIVTQEGDPRLRNLSKKMSSQNVVIECPCDYCPSCTKILIDKIRTCFKCGMMFEKSSASNLRKLTVVKNSFLYLETFDDKSLMEKLFQMLKSLLHLDIPINYFYNTDRRTFQCPTMPSNIMQELEEIMEDLMYMRETLIPNLAYLYTASCVWYLSIILFNYTTINMINFMEFFQIEDKIESAPPAATKSIQNLNFHSSCIICDFYAVRDDVSSISSIEDNYSFRRKKFCDHNVCHKCLIYNHTGVRCPLGCGYFAICVACLRYFIQTKPTQPKKSLKLYGFCGVCRGSLFHEHKLLIEACPQYFLRIFIRDCNNFEKSFKFTCDEIKSKYNLPPRAHYLKVKIILSKIPKITPIELLAMLKNNKTKKWLNQKLIVLHRLEKLARVFLNFLCYTAANPDVKETYNDFAVIVLKEIIGIKLTVIPYKKIFLTIMAIMGILTILIMFYIVAEKLEGK